MKKNMVYFVLYLILLSELLIVITERDELEAKDHEIRNKMLTTLAETYMRPVLLSIPQRNSEYNIGSKEKMNVVLTPAGLASEEEKKHVNYYVDIAEDSKSIPPNWPSGGLTLIDSTDNFRLVRQNGNAIFSSKIKNTGKYKFVAYCEVERQLPTYLPQFLLDSLETMIGDKKLARSNQEDFAVDAKRVGSVRKKRAEVSF